MNVALAPKCRESAFDPRDDNQRPNGAPNDANASFDLHESALPLLGGQAGCRQWTIPIDQRMFCLAQSLPVRN